MSTQPDYEHVSFISADQSIHSDRTDESQLLLPDNIPYIHLAFWRCHTSDRLLCCIVALPITFAMFIVSALAINYAIAVHLGHLAPIWPYVSWLASNGPEQYIFDFIFSLAIINVAFIIYFKFKTIDSLPIRDALWIKIINFNKLCSWVGFVTSVLFLVSATFPAVDHEPDIRKVHSVVSKAGFSVLCLYFIMESAMSFYIRNSIPGVTTCVCIIRTIFTCVCTLCLVLAYVAGKLSGKKFKGKDAKHWHHSDGGYVLHLVATFCEWGIMLMMVLFFLTYRAELKHFQTNVRLRLRSRAGRISNEEQQEQQEPQ